MTLTLTYVVKDNILSNPQEVFVKLAVLSSDTSDNIFQYFNIFLPPFTFIIIYTKPLIKLWAQDITQAISVNNSISKCLIIGFNGVSLYAHCWRNTMIPLSNVCEGKLQRPVASDAKDYQANLTKFLKADKTARRLICVGFFGRQEENPGKFDGATEEIKTREQDGSEDMAVALLMKRSGGVYNTVQQTSTSAHKQAFVGSSSKFEGDDIWLVDSGATDHMTHRRDFFGDFEEFEAPTTVRLCNGDLTPAYGKGNVEIETYVDGNGYRISKMSDASFEYLLEQQQTLFGHISRSIENVRKVGAEKITRQRAQGRLEALRKNWEKFEANNDKICAARATLNAETREKVNKLAYFSEEVFLTCEENFLDAQEAIQILVDDLTDNESSLKTKDQDDEDQPGTKNKKARLPKIDLPKFNGNYSEWGEFHDLFKSMFVSNTDLEPVEKLKYLKLCLSGNARLRLKNVALRASNFQIAWDDLVAYYENKRMLVGAALESLFSVKSLNRESASDLERLYSEIKQALGALEAVDRPVKYRDDILVFTRLGNSTQPQSKNGKVTRCQYRTANLEATHAITCSLCDATHYLSSCPKYLGKSMEQRREFLAQKRLCYNCLGPHQRKMRRSTKQCRMCGAQHHTSIHSGDTHLTAVPAHQHLEKTTDPAASASFLPRRDQTMPSGSASSNVAQVGSLERPPVLLATAVVKIISSCGEPLEARALLDQGSEISVITESLAQRLRLPRSRSSISIVGIGAESSRPSRGSVALNLQSRVRPTFTCNDLELADPNFAQPERADLVLGADVYGLFLEEGVRKGPVTAPMAQNTTLGWILSGVVPAANATSSQPIAQSFQCAPDRGLLELLQKFWMQEEAFSVVPDQLSPEETQCESHFAATHARNSEGRYIVRLPFKRIPENLGNSRSQALRVLTRQEKRFSNDSTLQNAYVSFMKEYENLGHMHRAADTNPDQNRVYYLPHLCVIRESSSSTKYRVVFNGSQQTDRGISLNDCLHEGPKLLTDLSDVITRWRVFKFVFSADVSKMFRQILVHPEDQDFQRILWRNSRGELVEFALCTVTYDLSSAPFLANRTLRQLDKDEGHRFPLAEGVIKEGTYVDDVFSGAHSLEQGREKIEHVANLFKAGGFPLKKWTANHEDLLESISTADRETAHSVSLDNSSFRTLGLTWRHQTDAFVFTLTHTSEPAVTTKRTVLSRTAQLFDPLGWLAPVVVRAKIFMQELWSAHLGWDEPLPQHLAARWMDYARQLRDVTSISVPRWLGLSPSALGVEIHGFSDASHAALGVVVYVRVLYDVDDPKVTIVSAKTKVAPIKKHSSTAKRSRTTRVTTPRLELSAAVLLVRHLLQIQRALKLDDDPVHLWTDSTTALHWIKGHPSRWKDFVRNQVFQIQELMPNVRWHHVPGEENPADLASRGLSPKQLAENPLWWQGPPWLSRHSTSWPSSVPPLADVDLEERQKTVTLTKSDSSLVWNLISRYSRLVRLLRITAWSFRVVERFRRRERTTAYSSPLQPEDIENARRYWAKSTQKSYFSKEMQQLSQGVKLSRSSPLIRLVPFLDSDGMLRVGRLRNALLDPDVKHPLILPQDSELTHLVLDDVHRATLHGGAQVMLATLRRSYWIIGGRVPVRSFVLRCVICTRQRAATATQLMG
ncbi:uncharacterized protein LOC143217679 [Lasioglossum baleicum]|uniref:uncharacterized protein LOC143217679 n=1 Tax=Lasioglossum baleicum TaxID=434251 RepID=UPI003FCDD2A1